MSAASPSFPRRRESLFNGMWYRLSITDIRICGIAYSEKKMDGQPFKRQKSDGRSFGLFRSDDQPFRLLKSDSRLRGNDGTSVCGEFK